MVEVGISYILGFVFFGLPMIGIGAFQFFKFLMSKYKVRRGYYRIIRHLPNKRKQMVWCKPEMGEDGGIFRLSDKLSLIFKDSPEYISYTGVIPEVEYDSKDIQMLNSTKDSNRTKITTHTILVDDKGVEVGKITEHDFLNAEQPTGAMLAYLGMESEERGRRKALKKDNMVLYLAGASAIISLIVAFVVFGLSQQLDALQGLPELIRVTCSNRVIN